MKIICCEKEITEVEEGVNGSDFYVCPNCRKTYNVIEGKEKE
jgi:transposase-like protein